MEWVGPSIPSTLEVASSGDTHSHGTDIQQLYLAQLRVDDLNDLILTISDVPLANSNAKVMERRLIRNSSNQIFFIFFFFLWCACKISIKILLNLKYVCSGNGATSGYMLILISFCFLILNFYYCYCYCCCCRDI